MKNFKKVAFGILSALLVTFVIVSCSDDGNETLSQNQTEQQTLNARGVNSGLDYAKNFYRTEVKLGKSLIISEDNVPQVILQEIIVSNDTRARGYVVTKVGTDDFLLFADVDRNTDVLTVYDNIENKTVKFDNLKIAENYLATDKFDFVKYTDQNVTTANKGCGFWKKLWGTCVSDPWTEKVGNGLCMDFNKITNYFLFQAQPGSISKNPISGAYPCE